MIRIQTGCVMSHLVVVSCLSSEIDPSSSGLVRGHRYGNILDIGFSHSPEGALVGRPPRPEATPYDNSGWMQDKFLYVAQRERGSALGTLEVAEALVADTYMRGNIDYTGIRLTIWLRCDAYEAYTDYIGRFPADLPGRGWDGRIRFSTPARPFSFPMPRGSSKPWDTNRQFTGRLRTIRRFDVDEFEVEALGREMACGSPGGNRTGLEGKLLLRSPRQGLRRLMSDVLGFARR